MTHQTIDEFLRASTMFMSIGNELHSHSRLRIRRADNSLQETFVVSQAHAQKHRRVHRERIARLQIARIGGDVCQAPPPRRRYRRLGFSPGRFRASRRRRKSVFDLPIRWGVIDSPKITGSIKFHAKKPGLWSSAERDHVRDSRCSLTFRPDDLKSDREIGRKGPLNYQATTVGIDQGGDALLGEFKSGIEAGNEDGNFERQSGTASNRVLFRRSTHGFES